MSLPRKRPKIAHPRCAVCRHPEKWRLELLRAGGASLDSLAAKFGLDRHAIHRHWHRHVGDEAKAKMLFGPVEMAALAEKAAIEGDSVLDYLRMCRTVLAAQLTQLAGNITVNNTTIINHPQFATVAGHAADRFKRSGELSGNQSGATSIASFRGCGQLAARPTLATC